GQRNLREEEENVGRQVEQTNARERRQWEAVYGSGTGPISPEPDSRDSGGGDTESEKKLMRRSQATAGSPPSAGEEAIEMSELLGQEGTPKASNRTVQKSSSVIMRQDSNGMVIVRVARDEVTEAAEAEAEREENAAPPAQGGSKRHSKAAVSPAP